MKRYWILRIILFLVAELLLIGTVFLCIGKHSETEQNTQSEQQNTPDQDKQQAIIKGTIVNADTLLILGNPSQRSSLCYLSTSENPVFYVDGKLSDRTEIKLGQTVEVTFSGMIAESYPGRVMGVTKICATTEDVSLLEGTIIEIEKRTIYIQDNENTEQTYQLLISEETFVCIQGLDASIHGLAVGQNVEIAYKEGIDDELPRATIILVKKSNNEDSKKK